MRRLCALVPLAASLLAVHTAASAQTTTSYQPGFYRLATKAAFLGRVRVESIRPATAADGGSCGVIHEARVVESIAGAAAGATLFFVAKVELGHWPPGGEAFAMLFDHAIRPDSAQEQCWLEAAPLFAAASPASVVALDARAGEILGGDFLRIAPDNVLAGLRFAAIPVGIDGGRAHVASWDLVRAYARQAPAALEALPTLPELPDPAEVDAYRPASP